MADYGHSQYRQGKAKGITSALQDRHSQSGIENGDRGGRTVAQLSQTPCGGCSEDGLFTVSRVANVSVYQQGSGPEFERLCPAGLVYDLTVRDNHNFFVNGYLVHNSHRLRNPESAQTQQFMGAARKAQNLLLLSGSPIVNAPSDIAPLISALTKKDITPKQFTDRYVGKKEIYPNLFRKIFRLSVGQEADVGHAEELKALLKGHVDYYAPKKSRVPTHYEDVHTTMGIEQSRLYKAMFDKLPFYTRWKLRHDYPLSSDELRRMRSFLTGPRQVGLSTYPYLRDKDPWKAFQQSPKLQEAHKRLMTQLQDPRHKALIFANFVDAGLRPYSAALARSKVPHAIFHGGLSDADRKKLVDDFNNDRIRVALLGPSGTEGLSFRGTQLVQLLDPDWQPVRPQQAVGRALRFDSHTDLPPELQKVKVERYVARLPPGLADRVLQAVGFDREHNLWAADDHLRHIELRKKKLNQKFLKLLQEIGSKHT